MTNYSGQYVRLLDSPKAGIGTIIDTKPEHGQTAYLFHQDERFTYKIRDYWADEGDFEPCQRPTDEYVAQVNAMDKRGQ
jgi:hypothetical protein